MMKPHDANMRRENREAEAEGSELHRSHDAVAAEASTRGSLALLCLIAIVSTACSRSELERAETAPPIANSPPRKSTRFGVSFAFCGDIDGDGRPDIAVGSPSESSFIPGQVFVYSGRTGRLIRVFADERGSAMFGEEITSIGDLDGDGVPELAARTAQWIGGRERQSIEILSGRTCECIRLIDSLPDEPVFGAQIESAGDLDGDGFEEILTCGGSDDVLYPGSKGRVVVVSAVSGERILSLDVSPTLRWGWSGRTLYAVGDVNGDGTPDFAIVMTKAVHVYSGCDASELLVLTSSDAFTEFGRSVCGIGDLDRDGFEDIAIGAPEFRGLPMELRGNVSVYSGRTGERLAKYVAPYGVARLGVALAQVGDANGDGVPDLLVSRNDVIAGGSVSCVSGKDGSTLFNGADSGRENDGMAVVGWRVIKGPDVDGDGTPDFMSSRYTPSAIGSTGQGVLLFSGKDGHVLHEFRYEPSDAR